MKLKPALITLTLLAAATSASAATVDVTRLSAQQTAALICKRQVTSAAVVEQWLSRIEAAANLNAFITVSADLARSQANAQDLRLARGEPCLPLGGVPIAIKDNIHVKGLPNTAGTPSLAKFYPASDAPVIQRLYAAGAVVIGKTNMAELAFGTSGYNTAYHVPGVIGVRNAFDHSLVSGGSSAGSAVALGARLAPVALGTDTGGSVRVPCSYNNCVALRPTVGRYSQDGITPISFTRDTAGPMAHTVGDVALIDTIITGAEAAVVPKPGSIRLGVPDFFWNDLQPEVAASADKSLQKLRDAGVQIVPVTIPHLKELTDAVATGVALHEAKVTLTRYLEQQHTGVSFDQLAQQISSPDVKQTFDKFVVPELVPTAAGVMPVLPVYATAMEKGLPALSAAYATVFADNHLDALIFPTAPDLPIKTGPQAGANFLRSIRNADPSSNVKMPGLTLPAGLSDVAHLPVGMEIDGLPNSDAKLLAIGQALENIWGPGAVSPLSL